MGKAIGLVGAALVVIGSQCAHAQQPALPTTVQLPSYQIFSVNTTVSVPDSGGAYLGGIKRARDASSTRGFGPLANRGSGSDRTAGGMSVHATIIDHGELDRATLAAAAARAPVDPVLAKADDLTRHVGRGALPAVAAPATSGESVATIRERNSAAAQQRAAEAADYLTKAEQAEAEGKPGVARIYYQMVARRAGGALQQQALARLAALANEKGPKVANR